MEDWAEEMAREWCASNAERLHYYGHESATGKGLADSLAALLREVYDRARSETLVRCCICVDVTAPRPDCECVICHRNSTLAEVRRVVLTVKAETDRPGLCDEILSRLEKL